MNILPVRKRQLPQIELRGENRTVYGATTTKSCDYPPFSWDFEPRKHAKVGYVPVANERQAA
jgi:hypothetical protein